MRQKQALGFSLLFAAIAVVIRFSPVHTNFAGFGALALFSSFAVRGWKGWAIPLAVLFGTDLIGHFGSVSDMGFYYGPTMLAVYLGYIPMLLMGKVLRWAKPALPSVHMAYVVPLTALVGSIGFFLISNFGSWLDPMMGGVYARSLSGLAECYWMAIPFFRSTLQSDVLFSCTFFGVWQLLAQDSKYRETASV